MAKKDQNPNPDIELCWADFQYNMSAALYLITEQQAMIGRLMEELARVGALNTDALVRITNRDADLETLNQIYVDLHKRYASYVLLSKNYLDKKDEDK